MNREELIDHLENARSSIEQRINESNWARNIASHYTMNLVNFHDRILEEAFSVIQCGNIRFSDIYGQTNSEESYFIRDIDYKYWIDVLSSTPVQYPSKTKLIDVHPFERRYFADRFTAILKISPETFMEFTSAWEHRTFDDLDYYRYVWFWRDPETQVIVDWYRGASRTGTVYAEDNNYEKTIGFLADFLGDEKEFLYQYES